MSRHRKPPALLRALARLPRPLRRMLVSAMLTTSVLLSPIPRIAIP